MRILCFFGWHHWHAISGVVPFVTGAIGCPRGKTVQKHELECCRCGIRKWKRYVVNY